jgi:hypothetical protein
VEKGEREREGCENEVKRKKIKKDCKEKEGVFEGEISTEG